MCYCFLVHSTIHPILEDRMRANSKDNKGGLESGGVYKEFDDGE